MFKYYKEEEENPFDNEEENAPFMFWGYESMFEFRFKEGNFELDYWVVPYASDINEWKDVFSKKPIDQEEIFKLWLFRLLMEHLPDKYQSDTDRFVDLYYQSKNRSIGLA